MSWKKLCSIAFNDKLNLEELWLDFDSKHDIHGHITGDHLDPTMAGIIEHFRKFQNFVFLEFRGIPAFKKHLVEDLLGGDIDKVVIVPKAPFEPRTYLKLSKKSSV